MQVCDSMSGHGCICECIFVWRPCVYVCTYMCVCVSVHMYIMYVYTFVCV